MPERIERKLKAILFADIEGFTKKMQQDESLTRNWVSQFKNSLTKFTHEYQGEFIQFYGDGCLCVFDSSVNAVLCAVELQKSFIATPRIPVRIGIHSGDVFYEEENVFGDSVNIASRVESIGVPGSVLLTERIYGDIKNKKELKAISLGEYEFKNVEDPLEIFAIESDNLVIPKKRLIHGKLKQQGSKKKTKINLRWLTSLILIPTLIYVIKPLLLESKSNIKSKNTIAIWKFENKTGDKEYDLLEEMVVDRIVHGITQNELAAVVRGEQVQEYSKPTMSSVIPFADINLLNDNLDVEEVISGSFYLDQEDLIFDCTISNAKTKAYTKSLESIRCPSLNPMDCIEELRQSTMGFIATGQSRKLNELREIRIPKYEAFKHFSIAKITQEYDKQLYHLNKAIEIDSLYFEPKVWKISNYFNRKDFTIADSLINQINDDFQETDLRQKNLLKFYDAWIQGKQDLVLKHFKAECKLAPFDLSANASLIVVALQFANQIDEAKEIYQWINEENIDYLNSNAGRIRLYLKLYMDIKLEDLDQAKRTGNLLQESGELTPKMQLLFMRMYARNAEWGDIDELIQVNSSGKDNDLQLYLNAAKECLLIGDVIKAKQYVEKGLSNYKSSANYDILGQLHYINGDTDLAISAFKKSILNKNDDLSKSHLAGILLALDKKESGYKLITEIESQDVKFNYGSIDYSLARAYMIAGEKTNAMTHLKKSVVNGNRYNFESYSHDYIFLDIKDDPDFLRLLKYWHK